MDLEPINRPTRAVRIQTDQEPRRRAGETDRKLAPGRADDSVQVSGPARALNTLKAGVPIREDLVTRVRAEIENETYETAEKLERVVKEIMSDEAELGEGFARKNDLS